MRQPTPNMAFVSSSLHKLEEACQPHRFFIKSIHGNPSRDLLA